MNVKLTLYSPRPNETALLARAFVLESDGNNSAGAVHSRPTEWTQRAASMSEPHWPRSHEAQKGQEQGTPESSFPAGGDAEPLPGTMLSEHMPPTKIAALAQLLQIIRNRES